MSDAVSPSGVRPAGPVVAPRVPTWLAAVLDVVLLLVFAGVGRSTHGEDVLLGLVRTSWPFLGGAILGWIVVLAVRRRAPVSLRDGLVVWVATIVGGMALRTATGAGTAVSFVVVATIVTGLFLLGWRAVAAVSAARRARRAA